MLVPLTGGILRTRYELCVCVHVSQKQHPLITAYVRAVSRSSPALCTGTPVPPLSIHSSIQPALWKDKYICHPICWILASWMACLSHRTHVPINPWLRFWDVTKFMHDVLFLSLFSSSPFFLHSLSYNSLSFFTVPTLFLTNQFMLCLSLTVPLSLSFSFSLSDVLWVVPPWLITEQFAYVRKALSLKQHFLESVCVCVLSWLWVSVLL